MKKHTVIFLVGEPGTGKTTAIKRLLGKDFINLYNVNNSIKFTRKNKLVLAGHYTGKVFDGSDTLPFNAAQKNLDFWIENFYPSKKYQCSIFDGDRFSYGKILSQLKQLNCEIICICFTCKDKELKERRDKRKVQNQKWLKGRATKVKNFISLFSNYLIFETTNATPQQAADFIKKYTRNAEITK